MSKPSTTSICCTGCGAEAPFVVWESLNATLNPDEKGLLLQGRLTLFTCERCGWSGHVIYPLLYHDMRRKFMVWLVPTTGESKIENATFRRSMPDYRFRRVCNLNELKEKIYLFDEGFDDREIEVLKLMIELRENRMEAPITGRLLFVELGTNEDGSPAIRFAQLGQERLKSLTVSAGALEAVAESLQGKLPAEEDMSPVWPTVNRAYAMAVMKSVRKQVGENERLEE